MRSETGSMSWLPDASPQERTKTSKTGDSDRRKASIICFPVAPACPFSKQMPTVQDDPAQNVGERARRASTVARRS